MKVFKLILKILFFPFRLIALVALGLFDALNYTRPVPDNIDPKKFKNRYRDHLLEELIKEIRYLRRGF